FDSGHPEAAEEGGRVYEAIPRGNEIVLRFGNDKIDFRQVHPGDRVWKTSDPELDRRLRQTFASDRISFQRPLHFEVHGVAEKPLVIVARDEFGNISQAQSSMVLEKARNRPLTAELLREQLGRLGGTPFGLAELQSFLSDDVVLPISELNRLRRSLISEIEAQRKSPKPWALNAPEEILRPPSSEGSPKSRPELVVLVRNLAQLEAILRTPIQTIYCEFADPKTYRDAVAMVRAAPGRTIWVAPPRIFKTGEEWIIQQVLSFEADGYLVRNYDHLKQFAGKRCIGDFSLNTANALTADYFIQKYQLERLTASYDLNTEQLESLLKSAPPEWFEITLHQHMPMFHMEHCVFCAFLSNGTDYRNCGRPCDKHDVQLRDRVGARHPLKADAGCRNTVFNSRAQTGAEFVDRFLAVGARRFRIELLNESPAEVARTIQQYQRLLAGELTGSSLWRELKLINQLGVTRGQLADRK
ncbi:MAG TPA: DUF3656 domain-containing protein, partial [Verrucomicrobiae bacterium]|nr:DUF3656 domain-containing protein [Verrucomicrobiae bacterium]